MLPRTFKRWRGSWRALAMLVSSSLALAAVLVALLTLDGQAAVGATPAGAGSLGGEWQRLRQQAWAPVAGRAGSARARAWRLGQPQMQRLLAHLGGWSGARMALHSGDAQAALAVSVPLALGPWTVWLNLNAELADGGPLPAVTRWQAGQMRLPTALAPWLVRRAVERALGTQAWAAWVALEPGFIFEPGVVTLRLATPVSQADLPALLAGPARRSRWPAYQARLADQVAAGRGPVELPALMQAMAGLAQQRSQGDPVAAADENRAWLQVLALYVNGRPAVREPLTPRPRQRQVLLAGRGDFPQHVLVSALLAAELTPPMADSLGLAKEVDDARHGSGFSFTDLAVNRAGTRLGTMARRQPLQLQQRLASGAALADWLPRVDDLPEFLSAHEFERRFGGVGGAGYLELLARIEARLDALALYR